jgi:HNH endonuclease
MSRISSKIQAKVRQKAKNRCGDCLLPQAILMSKLEMEHILPLSEGGADKEENLWLACRDCNSYKSFKIYGFDEISKRKVKLFNPHRQKWHRHFNFNESKTQIFGKTACGRATVIVLRFNKEQAIKARMLWITAGWYPPID